MNSSELLRRRQEATNQYKSYWKPRDASEVTIRNGTKGANYEVRTPYYRPNNFSNYPPNQADCGPKFGPGDGFSPNYTNDTVVSAKAACAVCQDENWSKGGGYTLKTDAAVNSILYTAPITVGSSNYYITNVNPITGLTWATDSTGTIFQQLTGNCPPNNSVQTPRFVSDPNCLPRCNLNAINPNNVYSGRFVPKYAKLA